ncbi:M16 family metallopeptidase [Granulicella arctica]|uniref:M16 family metallopeptidase n=1 Tax=Granulicella arctica TaxID=940613 RepID=UPI0021DFF556|nr:pitrilysin family protein [Granulicella arctica]
MKNPSMKLFVLGFVAPLTVSVALAQAVPAHAAASQPWKRIAIPPLHEFKPVQPRRVELANGLIVLLEEDHELPFISGRIVIRGGSRDEPAAKVGLASLYGQTWRTSGTAKVSGDALDDLLDAKAATVETGGGQATSSVSWSSLKGDFDTVFGITTQLLLHPDFKQDKLQLAKRRTEASIARRNDDASGIAGREATQLVYGADSPYGRETEFATIEAVGLDDLKAWHEKTVTPNNMIVAVSGDFDSAAMEAKLRTAFEPLPKGAPFQTLKASFPGPKPGVYLAEKTDVDQSNVYIVGLGTTEDNPDYYALDVMNQVFSGGFGSRVVQNVRTKLGLAYDVGGSFGASYDHPGMFYVGAGTKSESTVEATKAMMAEIGRLKTVPPTPDELRKAKEQVLNSFVFNYDSPEKVLGEQVTLAFFGYPTDFLERYRVGIDKVTSADVARVANKYIDESKLATVVVGNAAQFNPPLSSLGKVTTLDITIPPMPKK